MQYAYMSHTTSIRHLGPDCFLAFLITLVASLMPCGYVTAQEAAPTQTAVVIPSVPYTIKTHGIYILRSNLVLKSATGIAISVADAAYDVTIDLGGRILSSGTTANNANSSTGILLSGSGMLVVRNGVLRGFAQGVGASAAQAAVSIENITCMASGSAGIDLNLPSDATVQNCVVQDTGYITNVAHSGIEIIARVIQVSNCRIAETNSINNGNLGAAGIEVAATASDLISNCFVTGNSATGVSLGIDSVAGYTSLIGNTVCSCDFGFSIVGTASGKYMNNITVNCSNPFTGGASVGINN